MKHIINGLTGVFSNMFDSHHSDGLVRMFETEYNKEYRSAVRSGVVINDRYIRDFLNSRS